MPKSHKPVDPQSSAGILAELVRNAQLVWRLLHDRRVPVWMKAIVPATLLYIISPIDLLPDLAVGVGQLDDLAILLLGVKSFLSMVSPEIVKEHLADIIGESTAQRTKETPELIEGQYRVMEEEKPHEGR